jgi:hypothetical protein
VVFQVLTDFVPSVAYRLVGFTGSIEFTALLRWGIELWRTYERGEDELPKTADRDLSTRGTLIVIPLQIFGSKLAFPEPAMFLPVSSGWGSMNPAYV